jgi:hypothetical protein
MSGYPLLPYPLIVSLTSVLSLISDSVSIIQTSLSSISGARVGVVVGDGAVGKVSGVPCKSPIPMLDCGTS